MNRFDNQRGTAPIVDSIKNEKPNIRYSKFDLSSQIAFDAHIGWIIPFDLIETLPDSDYTINYDIVAITRNPLVRRLLSGMSVYIHTYGEDLKDMWEGFPRFITRGRSGTANLQIPVTMNHFSEDGAHFYSSVYSPSSYLGVVPKLLSVDDSEFSLFNNSKLRYWHRPSIDSSTYVLNPDVTFNALPLVMYQQICIHNYMPSNLLQHNKNFFPDNELHLILSDDSSGEIIYSLSYDVVSAKHTPDFSDLVDVAIADDLTPVVLDSMRVRQFRGDEFTTGLPFPDLVRGQIPTIDIGGSVTIPSQDAPVYVDVLKNPDGSVATSLNLKAGFAHSKLFDNPPVNNIVTGQGIVNGWNDYNMMDDEGGTSLVFAVQSDSDVSNVLNTNLGISRNTSNVYAKTSAQSFTVASALTMSQLRSLAVLTKFREIMARTDGSYNEMIKSQFGSSPQLHNHKPFYIGGIKQDLVFSEVVQTSESSANTPLGTTASRGITAGSGYVGKYHSKDYGYIMSVLSIVPDVFYHQGLDKKWSRINQSDFYFPINNNLSPEGLLNKRLYVSGSSATDDGLFAYQERDSDYKSRRNRVAGRLIYTFSQSEEDNAYVMKRTFSTTPTLSYGFTGMFPSNIDMSIFASANDTPFIFNIASRISAVQPMPYTTTPSDLGIIS